MTGRSGPPAGGRPKDGPGERTAPPPAGEADVYARIGEDGFRRLVGAFYRGVAADDVLRPMYPPEDLAGAEERLRDFLVGRFGGPPRYLTARGHPRLRARHMPFPIDPRASARWLELMERAFGEAQLPPEVEALLREYFRATAAAMVNRR